MSRGPDLAPAERRIAARASVMRDGQAFHPDGLAATVLIIDLSATGARLRVRGRQALPDAFILADPATFTAYGAGVVWRRDAEVGVSFSRSVDLRAGAPAGLEGVRAFCLRAHTG